MGIEKARGLPTSGSFVFCHLWMTCISLPIGIMAYSISILQYTKNQIFFFFLFKHRTAIPPAATAPIP